MFKLFGFSKNKNCIFVWMEGVDYMHAFVITVVILVKRLVSFFSPETTCVVDSLPHWEVQISSFL